MLIHYLYFLAKTVTLIVAILLLLFGIIAILSKGKNRSKKDTLSVKCINEKYEEMRDKLREKVLDKKTFKQLLKDEKKATKTAPEEIIKKRIFVLSFNGDIRASAVKSLREEVTGILTIATPSDTVVLRLESPGGMVHAYGLASSQLQRFRKNNIPLVAIVDKIAASGGYMMAAVANEIFAAPFAVVGSIGVVAQLPNFNRLLKKNDIEFEQITAGQYKRTLTLFGENTEQDRQKFQEEVNDTHALFKAFIQENRPVLDLEKVATGEHWYGSQALALNLIDGLMTSDDYLLNASKASEIYEVQYCPKKSLMDKCASGIQKGKEALLSEWML